ncbi:hypothetical protein [Streptomyces sp. NPDC059783]|uniref:hypothetical protein n=1 Tax=Streptomyces sp. NPDC059783 TaxID=3346944 RepID=UPI00366649EA
MPNDHIEPGAITSSRIEDGAIQAGNIIEDLQSGDPKMIEALILTALSRTTLNGLTDLGPQQARRFLDLYKQHILDEARDR